MASYARTAPRQNAAAALDMEYDYLFKILVVGDSAVGKSCLVSQFADDKYSSSYISTIGVDFKIKTFAVDSGKVVKLQMWDTAGQERFRAITNSYYHGGHGILLCYDVTDPQSLANVSKVWLREVSKYAREDVKVVLVGNKSDLAASTRADWDDREEAEALAREHGMTLLRTSAKTGEGVESAFRALVDELIAAKHKGGHGAGGDDDVLELPDSDKVKVGGGMLSCCA